jgi:hypothetical protein
MIAPRCCVKSSTEHVRKIDNNKNGPALTVRARHMRETQRNELWKWVV